MAFIVLSTSAKEAFESTQSIVRSLNNYCANRRTAIAAGGLNTNELLATEDNFITQRDRLIIARDVKGVVPYARDQVDDQAYAFKVELNAVVAAIDNALAELYSVIPTDANDNIKCDVRNVDNTRSPEVVNTATLATLDTLLAAIIATISIE